MATNPGSTPPAVSSITGNPVIDAALRSLIMTVTASLSTICIAYLANHGVSNENLAAQMPTLVGAVISLAVTVAVGIWGVIAKRQTLNAVVTQSIAAAQTGVVPDAVKALATLDQKAAIIQAAKQ